MAVMTAAPDAPAVMVSPMLAGVTPPMARMGIWTAWAAVWIRGRPPVGAPGWDVVGNTLPRVSRSAPWDWACIAPWGEWTERARRRRFPGEAVAVATALAAHKGRAVSPSWTPWARAARAMSMRSLMKRRALLFMASLRRRARAYRSDGRQVFFAELD